MEMVAFPFGVTDWSEIPATIHAGDRDTASWRSRFLGISGIAWSDTAQDMLPITGAIEATFCWFLKAH